MLKFNFKVLLILLFAFLWHVALANSTRITNFRFARQADKIRLVFDASDVINYKLQEVSNKIIIDLKKAILVGNLNKDWLNKTPITNVQSKQVGENLQIILFLKNNIKIKHFILTEPYRLVLDFPVNSAVQPNDSKAAMDKLVTQVSSHNVKTSKKIEDTETKIIDHLRTNVVEQPIKYDEPTGSRDVIIVIDPGHGGKDPGAVGRRGTYEKHIALAVSKELQKMINRVRGFKAILTRNGDYFVPLRGRLGIAHRHKADMFIAIHADAYKRSSCGASVFALSQRGATSEAARWIAEKENESELGKTIYHKNPLLRSVLIDLAQSATISSSLEVGEVILRELRKSVPVLHSPRLEQAGFVVLKSPDIPSLLVEMGFISNPREEAKLRSSNYQHKLALCLASGITRYFLYKPPKGTYLAQLKIKK